MFNKETLSDASSNIAPVLTISSGISVSERYLTLYLSLFLGSLSLIALITDLVSLNVWLSAGTETEAAAYKGSLISSLEFLAMIKASSRDDLPDPEAPTTRQLKVLR